MHKCGLAILIVLAGVWILGCKGGVAPPATHHPSQWRGITIYSWDVIREGRLPPSLAEGPHYEVSEASTRMIASGLQYRHKVPIWKGSCLGVVQLESGGEAHVAVSLTMGFIQVLDQSGYYVAEGQARKELDSVMERAYRAFAEQRNEGIGSLPSQQSP